MESSQLKLGIIPEYADSRLYIVHNIIKNRFIDTGRRKLVFYSKSDPSEHYSINELMSIEFPNFHTAYKYISDFKINNFNIRQGSYKEEIKQMKGIIRCK